MGVAWGAAMGVGGESLPRTSGNSSFNRLLSPRPGEIPGESGPGFGQTFGKTHKEVGAGSGQGNQEATHVAGHLLGSYPTAGSGCGGTQGYQYRRTGVGGLPEMVRHEEDALVVAPSDERALAAAIDRFFDTDLKERLSEGAKRARERFTWKTFTDGLLLPEQGDHNSESR